MLTVRRPVAVLAACLLALGGSVAFAGPAGAVAEPGSDVAFTSAPSGEVEATWAAFSFFSETAASYECALDGAAYAACTDATRGQHRVTGLSFAAHSLSVRSVNAAGVRGTPVTAAWTAVRGPLIRWDSKPSGTIANTTVTAVFSAPGADRYECKLDALAWASCTGYSQGYHVMSSLAQGPHTLIVRAVRSDGSTAPESASTFTVESPLGIEWVSRPTGTIPDSDVTAVFSAAAASYYQCAVDAGAFGSCTGYSSGHHALHDLAPGEHTLHVRAVSAENAVGPVASTSFSVAPQLDVSWLSKPEGTIANSTVTAMFSAPQAARYECQLDGNGFGSCSGYSSGYHTMSGLKDGAHTLTVRAVDAQNVIGPETSAAFTVAADLAITWVSKPEGTVTNTTVAAVFVAAQAGHYECQLDGGGYTGCGGYSRGTHVLTSLSPGSHTLHVRAVSPDGVVGPPASATFTVEPALALTVHGDPSAAPGGVFAAVFSAPDASWYECSLDSPTAFGPCSGYGTGYHVVSGLATGAHTVRIRAVSSLGARGPVTEVSTTSSAPSAGELAVVLNDATSRTRPVSHFAASFAAAGASYYECSVDAQAASACYGSFTASNVAEGAHTLSVHAVDSSGRPGPATTVGFTVGPTGAVAVTSSLPSTVATSDVALAFSAPGASYYSCALDGQAPSACYGSFTAQGLAEGSHTIAVSAVGTNGAEGPATTTAFVVDTARAPVVTSLPPSTTTSAHYALAFSAPRASYYECQLDDSAAHACYGSWTQINLLDGQHTISVRAIGTNGAAGPWTVLPFVVDTKQPVILTSAMPAAPAASREPVVAVAYYAAGASYYECRLDDAAWSACYGTFAQANVPDGAHVLRIRALSVNGQAGPELAVPFVVDTKPPVVLTSALPARPSTLSAGTAAVAFYGWDAGYFECRLGSAAFSACYGSFAATGLGDGEHTLQVRAYASNGQVGPTLSVPFTVDSRPATDIVSAPSSTGLLPAKHVAVSYSSPGASSYSCRLDGGAAFACGTGTDGTWLGKDLSTGRHVLEVTSTVGGVTGQPRTVTFTIRKDAPETSLTSAPPSRTRSTSASFTFTGTDPTPVAQVPGPGPLTFLCSLDGAAAAPCTSPDTRTGLGEGPHTFSVTAVNDQGRLDPTPATTTWTVDLTPPALSITGGPTGTVTTRSGSVSFTVDGTATSVTCQLDSGTPTACTSPVSYSGLADGPHTVTARASDDVGNVSTATRTWTVDATPPAVAITDGPPARTTDRAAVLVFTTGDAASVTCTLDGSPVSPCQSPQTVSDLPLGSHSFTVTGVDAAGNSASASRSWTVLSSVPVPDTAIDSGPTGPTSLRTATVAFSADVAGSTFECSLDSAAWAACTSPADLTGLTDGTHVFAVRALNEAGTDETPASRTWVVDGTAPTVTLTSGPPATTADRGASFAFTATDATTSVVSTTCRLDTGSAVPCTSPVSYSALEPGEHVVEIVATDAAGNTGSASRTWTVLEAPPVPDTTITGGPTGKVRTRTATFSFTATDPDATFECKLDAGAWAACTSPKSYASLVDGSHVFQVRASNAGGTDATPATRTWTVDGTAPTVTITSGPEAGSTSPLYTATFGLSITDALSTWTATCQLDSATATPCTTTSPTYTGLLPGSSHVFTVRATDEVGNVRTLTRSWTVGVPAVTVAVVLRDLAGVADSSHGLGDDFTEVLTVTNAGTASATSTVGRLTLGSGINLVTLPAGCTRSGQVVSCSAGTLAPGAGKSFTVKVEGKLSCTRWGNSGNNTVTGTSANDVICGGGGADTITTGGGTSDRVYGYGPPVTDLTTLDSTPSASFGPGTRSASGTARRVTIGGTDGNDVITGGSGTDYLYGQDGDDRVVGGAGNDRVEGGNGLDMLYGGAGSDTVYGGAGDDRLFGEDGDTLESNAVGGSDRLYGDAGNDFLWGEGGSDTVLGGAGDDDLFGGYGDDDLQGQDGRDRLYGGVGNDTISGGTGHDSAKGGAGNDVMNGGTGRDLLYGEDGNDVVDGGPAGGSRTAAPGDHWNRLYGGTGTDACSYGPGSGTDNTDYRDATCERLSLTGSSVPGKGWLNGSAAVLARAL